ncbi:glucan biosynthesis protein [Rhodovibrio salinarum]|uniref:Glucan biosynthesis protein D n=1 Tax=Rhodovibrio salinarum TaxID=1087 RepID=A0A934QFH0_9PROT|nr:glucan biosynthesis protein D [Rhodovibrio salinarum]MBK1695823.1 glucan biosynthesis protein D [Rhodovibrio salinarum]
MTGLTRRTMLQLSAAAGLARLFTGPAQAQAPDGLKLGPAESFSYEWLKRHARELAAQPYDAPPRPDPEIVQRIDYDAHGKLDYRMNYALFPESAYPISFQHVGMYFPKTVQMHKLTGSGDAREVLYDPGYFDVGPDHVASDLPEKPSAFAGFWVHQPRSEGPLSEVEPWATFLGGCYFRGIGESGQIGMSARGVALDPGGSGAEEFPDFRAFWFEPAASEAEPVTVYALLDGPSVTGAYKFLLHRNEGVVMDIEANLHLRKKVERLGLAPLTSMYWFSETRKETMTDWRPEVHDSDGLYMWTGNGERIWRPLNNPDRISISSFQDRNPRGFGLMQRDREFDNYLDGVRYHRRPSSWVEPLHDWGPGVVQLVEIPTDDEIHDNINAIWIPDGDHGAGTEYHLNYKLYWMDDCPYPSDLARCVATRLGHGGQAGRANPKDKRKFVVEFKGGPLEDLPKGTIPEPVLTASRGSFSNQRTEAVPNDVPGHWRTMFDLTIDGADPIELRCYLRTDDQVLTETWLYQYHPLAEEA